MKAIAVNPGKQNILLLTTYSEPDITLPDQVKIRVSEVGICGTDREEVAGGRSKAPQGQDLLVIGHEMFGQVVAVGTAVTRVKVGDYAAFTVRRGCGKCLPCQMNRPDMCETGEFTERGIWGENGYQTELVVDREQYVVRIPTEIKACGVLAEPTSIVEKAIDEAVRLQAARLPDAPAAPAWLYGRRCLVAGLGPVGLLGALILRLRGAEVYGLDIVDPAAARPRWLAEIGGTYVDGRDIPADQIDRRFPAVDLILEASGVPALEFNLLDGLANDGIYVLTGIPGGDRPLQIDGADLIRSLVLKNLLMVGSVNAARDHFQMGVEDLYAASLRWPGLLERLITSRHTPDQFMDAFGQHPADEIKSVIHWDAAA
jgi:threonine dehydrogenase-like Zn-dependent dehydrogenase